MRNEQTASGNILGGPAPTNESPFGDYTPLTVKSAYTDVLPSVNLRVNVTDDLVARFAAGRTVARANFAQLAPGINLNGTRLLSAGNPLAAPAIVSGRAAGTIWKIQTSWPGGGGRDIFRDRKSGG